MTRTTRISGATTITSTPRACGWSRTFARKNRASQVAAANIDQQPLTVDFQSIGDAEVGDKIPRGGKVIFSEEPDSIQQITTQGQDIQEISVASSDVDMR